MPRISRHEKTAMIVEVRSLLAFVTNQSKRSRSVGNEVIEHFKGVIASGKIRSTINGTSTN